MALKLAKIYNPNSPYCVKIKNKSHPGDLLWGFLIAPISLQTANTWENLAEIRGGNVFDYGMQRITDRSTVVRQTTQQLWRGSEIPKISLQMGRVALFDAKKEIIEDARIGLRWNLSRGGSTLMKPPIDYEMGCIDIQVGKWLNIKNMLPVSCDVNFDTTMDRYQHAPIKHEMTMQLQCDRAIDCNELDAWFK